MNFFESRFDLIGSSPQAAIPRSQTVQMSRVPRLHVNTPLSVGLVAIDRTQANYLTNVMRLKAGDAVLLFNGTEGEWRARLVGEANKPSLAVLEQTRTQPSRRDLHYVFAPIKAARLDYMVQKAVEMGASRLQPVMTRHTQVDRINLHRMQSNAIEAAEQCGILSLAEIGEPTTLEKLIPTFEPSRVVVFCDEQAPTADAVKALSAVPNAATAPLAVIVGPEGGFAEEERNALLALPNVVRLGLGPRILRADTAAIAALALVGAVIGDWQT